jgi:uncharacterized NAD(P)/FAD-binding protein YdhS
VSGCTDPPGERTPVVAIVGGGCAGTLVAANLLRRYDGPLRVLVIERSGRFGPGVAYSTEDRQHLLNVPAQGMSAFCDAPSHFADWTVDRFGASVTPASYLSRGVYGEYLRAVLSESQAHANPQRTLQLLKGEVAGLHRTRTGIELTLLDGTRIACDRAVLATGPLPGPGISQLPRDPRVIDDPWAAGALSDDPTTANRSTGLTLVVGTGLSAIDATVTICTAGGSVAALSRGGLLPHAHLPGLRTHAPPPVLPQAKTTLANLEHLVRDHVRNMQREGYDWRDAIDGLRPVTPDLWSLLTIAERRRFLDGHIRTWETRRHRMAPEVGARLDALRRSGQMEILAGTIVAARATDGAVEVDVADSQTNRTQTLHCERVVVCTGAGTDISRTTDPLLGKLLADGSAIPDPLGLGLQTNPDGALLDSDRRVGGRLFTLGSLRRGELWETTAVQEIRAQAECVARAIEQSLIVFAADLDRRPPAHETASDTKPRPSLAGGRKTSEAVG